MSTPTINWYVSSNGTSWTLCSTAGICNPVLTYRTNGIDELTWQMPGDFLADPAYSYGSTIYLACGVTTDGTTVYTCRFVGRITSIPRQAASASEVLSYRASGGWWWLEQVTYAQQWQTIRSLDNALVNTNILRVVLGQSDAGLYIDSGAQISSAVAYAIAVGAPLALGTIDTLATLPCSEHICLRCADVIRQLLRFQPDVVCWFDYDNRVDGVPVPKFYCRAPANLSTVSVPVLATDLDTITMTPRYDIQVPGVHIMYEQTHTYNGASYRNIATDDAGTATDARAPGLYFELQGSSAQTVEQAVVVVDYPASPYTDKTFWRAIQPWLDEILDADLAIQNVTRDGVASPLLPSYMSEGQIPPWMLSACGLHAEVETWEADISYTRKVSGTTHEKVELKHVSVKLLSTDAVTKTYSSLVSYSSGESLPSGVAAALYASWSRLHWDGQFRMVEAEASFQAMPGSLVNLTGGRSEWSTMAALVQDVTVDLTSGATTIRTGTCGRLEADSLMALWRGAHFRRFSWNRNTRTDASLNSSGAKVSGGTKLARSVADSADAGQAKIKRYTGTDSGSRAQNVLIDPSAITFANAPDAAAKTMQIREIRVLEKQGDGTYKAKLAQVLCSDIYNAGDAMAGAVAALDDIGDVTITTAASGDLLKWNGSAWVNIAPTQVTYVTAVQVDATNKLMQIKTRTGYLVSPGSESAWTTITGGEMVQGVTA
jgi:hypothetical protein